MKSVGESLSMLSGIWSDITTTLKALEDNFYEILNNNPAMLKFLRKSAIDEWSTVLKSVDKYIHVVTRSHGILSTGNMDGRS